MKGRSIEITIPIRIKESYDQFERKEVSDSKD